jgi:hypothetical protein
VGVVASNQAQVGSRKLGTLLLKQALLPLELEFGLLLLDLETILSPLQLD